MFFLTIAALGVVFGDIGTGPLYAINEIFFGHPYSIDTNLNILGPISLVIWTLFLVITIKYLFLVLRADHDGEGGVFALYGKLHHHNNKSVHVLKIILMLASGLLLGESIITPAISVLASVEGVTLINPAWGDKTVFITIIILFLLFLFQSKGTHAVGKVFGGLALLWFLMISFLGIKQIFLTPEILHALNPVWALHFLLAIKAHQLLIILGSVMLVITGGEAVFADMGHFGKKPIQIGWLLLVFPAISLNYLGQGAYILSGQVVYNKNIFFSMVPHQLLIPSVIIATCATIIASQALISGAFSLASQAVGLGLFPRLQIVHTNHEHAGQIYIGVINWMLFFGAALLVLAFKQSTSLAALYGLSVSGVMLSTTIAMMAIAHFYWKWSKFKIALVFIPFFFIDFTFLFSNSLKLLEGGYIPLGLGLSIFTIIRIWRWGRKATYKAYQNQNFTTVKAMLELKKNQTTFIDKNIVLMVPKPIRKEEDQAPALLQLFYNRYGMFPKNLFLLEVVHRKEPYIHGARFESHVFCKDPIKGTVISVTIHFGFMEDPNVELVLADLLSLHKLELPTDPNHWLIHVSYEKLIPPTNMSLFEAIRFRSFLFLRQITQPSYFFYGLGQNVNLSIEILPIKLERFNFKLSDPLD
jgi:KUP system potassium uptake protein